MSAGAAAPEAPSVDEVLRERAAELLARRASMSHWEGRLASSALSTATASLALHLVGGRSPRLRASITPLVEAGAAWLLEHQNDDGGWGDTVRSRSNISTTAIVWAVLSEVSGRAMGAGPSIARAEAWLGARAGGLTPDALRAAVLARYGTDRTFSVPILTVLALAGRLATNTDTDASWRLVPQLPFELAAVPHRWFRHLRLPVVSYALPALVAMGQVRHRFAPTRNPVLRLVREAARERTLRVLQEMQPESGGYLEAAPLTSFVVMSLAAMGRTDSPVVERGLAFLVGSMRADGSWPIDVHLATWGTTLSVVALTDAGALPDEMAPLTREWLLRQQTAREHPFTHAAPGGWAWTPLSGGVPDADDTAGALVALARLGEPDAPTIAAAASGAEWLMGIQNRDGGVPTFCRGWGTLPFDRSTPEITAHALRGWSAWYPHVGPAQQSRIRQASARALAYLASVQRPDGAWVPLWFGNEQAPDEENLVYGSSRVLLGLCAHLVRDDRRASACRRRAVDWLLDVQNDDGGWGGHQGVSSSVEETGVVLSALCSLPSTEGARAGRAVALGARYLAAHAAGSPPAPIGLYFARLWYFEELYPLIFAVEGLAAACRLAVATTAGAGAPLTFPDSDPAPA